MGIKYAVNEQFFDEWSNEMAYVLGYFFADGSLEDASYLRGKYVRVTSTDYDRITAFKDLLTSSHTIVQLDRTGNRKKGYLLRIGSHVLYDRLNVLGVTPRKSFTMRFPSVPLAFMGHFVRGYFDGDGCVHIGKNPAGISRLVVIFTSGSKEFLQSLLVHLRDTGGVQGGSLHAHGSTAGTFQLRFFARDGIRLFSLMYPKDIPSSTLLMRRKYDIFMRYFEGVRSTPNRRISQYIPQGPVVKG